MLTFRRNSKKIGRFEWSTAALIRSFKINCSWFFIICTYCLTGRRKFVSTSHSRNKFSTHLCELTKLNAILCAIPHLNQSSCIKCKQLLKSRLINTKFIESNSKLCISAEWLMRILRFLQFVNARWCAPPIFNEFKSIYAYFIESGHVCLSAWKKKWNEIRAPFECIVLVETFPFKWILFRRKIMDSPFTRIVCYQQFSNPIIWFPFVFKVCVVCFVRNTAELQIYEWKKQTICTKWFIGFFFN